MPCDNVRDKEPCSSNYWKENSAALIEQWIHMTVSPQVRMLYLLTKHMILKQRQSHEYRVASGFQVHQNVCNSVATGHYLNQPKLRLNSRIYLSTLLGPSKSSSETDLQSARRLVAEEIIIVLGNVFKVIY